LDTNVYKSERFKPESGLDVRTHFKPTETFQDTHFSTCHPSGVNRGFIKREALRVLRTNSAKTLFQERTNFKIYPLERGHPENFIQTTLYNNNNNNNDNNNNNNFSQKLLLKTDIKPSDKNKKQEILPFVKQDHPAVPNLKPILTNS